MIEKGNRIMFLLGAGASAPMGIPTMREFTKNFIEYGEKTIDHREEIGYWLRNIKRVTKTKSWNLEQLLSHIRQVKNIKKDININLLDRYLHKGNSQNRKRYLDKTDQLSTQFNHIEKLLLKYIRDTCLNPKIDIAKNIYAKLLEFSNEYILEIFTTNYDSILETISSELGYIFSDGFIPDRRIGAFEWNTQSLGSEKINIYKLHGSVTWYRKQDKILKFSEDISGSPGLETLMLYPTELKEILNPPYNNIHRKFEDVLFNTQLCLVVGHSFGDEYIKNLFQDRLKEKKFKIYFINGRFSKSMKKKIFGRTNRVSPIPKKFEDVDLTNLIKKHLV